MTGRWGNVTKWPRDPRENELVHAHSRCVASLKLAGEGTEQTLRESDGFQKARLRWGWR